ncbi:PL29 family lyase N-terminal domain-containing protein [Phocaeicola sp.]
MKHKTRSKQFTLWIMALTLLLLSGCYNDDKLWDAVNEQEQRIAALETWQKVVNGNIEALQRLVTENDYITTVTPVTLNGETVGYTIAFKTQPPITIYNGAKGDKGDKGEQGDKGDKGEDGNAADLPLISLTQGEDGNWYWTLNGTLMTDAQGNPIRANGQDGKDGNDGQDGNDGAPGQDGNPGQSAPTPQLKTGQELIDAGTGGTWTADAVYLSVDDGNTWTRVSGKDGTDSSATSAITKVEISANGMYVQFTLADDSTIDLPTKAWADAWEQQVDNLNNNVKTLQELTSGKKFITSVTPLGDGTGYTINFSEGESVTIKQGEKGETGDKGADGVTPTVEIKEGCWWINGTNTSVKATGDAGAPGAAGADGKTPTFKIEDGELKYQFTGDKEWTSLGSVKGDKGEQGNTGATGPQGPQGTQGIAGPQGDAIFAKDGIDYTKDDYVEFTLAGDDGKTFTVPRYVELGLTFSQNGSEITDPYASAITIDTYPVISYQFVGTAPATAPRVSALFSDADGWKVTVDRNNQTITVTDAPTAGERELIIMVTDSKGNARNYALTLERTTFNSNGNANTYTISDAGELAELAKLVNSGKDQSGNTFVLTQDIDLTGRNWTPIGIYDWPNSLPFKGTFDGQEHTISGLTIKSSQRGLGLFGYSGYGATIKNITLLSPQIECGEKSEIVGALIGYSYGTITNCYVKGGEIKSKGSHVGGLIGFNHFTITNCHAENMSISGTRNVGGLMGECDGSTVTNCHAKCTVTATGDKCGGLVGRGNTNGNLTITACYTQGDVTGNGSSVGGLIGECVADSRYTITIKSCYYAGTVTNNASDKPIGFVGSTYYGTPTFTACYGAFTTGTTGLTSFTGVNYVTTIGSDQISSMNSETSNSYNSDGTLKSEKKQ